jgi:site-specific DNA-methyltransferase (adenine-specific)
MVDKKNGVKARGKAIPVASTHFPTGKYADGKEKLTGNDLAGVEYKPETDEGKKWNGWGTALKPAQEPIVLARKPISESTIAKNVIKYGTGAINIDESRVEHNEDLSVDRIPKDMDTNKQGCGFKAVSRDNKGRWPANIIHDGSEEVLELFPEAGNGSAARFFYCAKANKQDRDSGCEKLDAKSITNSKGNGLGRVCNICSASILKPCECENNSWILPATNKNNHPTVKPTALMQYLVRMITPIGGTILDPFNGSGSTGKAAMLLGEYNYIGIDLSSDYISISKARIEDAIKNAGKVEEDITEDTAEEETNFFIE